MGRPRKAPARITTFTLPITLADRIDDLNLKNRSAWATKVITDHFAREEADREGIEMWEAVQADPAARISEIPRRRLAAALLGNLPPFERDPITAEKISTKPLQKALRNYLSIGME